MKYQLLLSLFGAAACYSQTNVDLCDLYVQQLAAINAKAVNQRAAEITDLLRPDQHAVCIAMTLAAEDRRSALLKTIEALRTDKQADSGVGGSSGATSLVSKGIGAKALSIASDYGALTQSVSGQSVTVKGSLDGFPGALIRGGLVPYCLAGIPPSLQRGCLKPSALNLLRRLSYGVTFDTSRSAQSISGAPAEPPATGGSTTVPVTFMPSGHQISQITGRVEFLNERDTTSSSYTDLWLAKIKDKNAGSAVSDQAQKLLTAFQTLFDVKFRESPDYMDWFKKAADTLQKSANPRSDWADLYSKLVTLVKSQKDVVASAVNFATAVEQYDLAQDDLIADAAKKTVLALEYANNRPAGVDSDSTFRLIFDKGFGKHWSLTANIAADIWDHDQSTASTPVNRLRDLQAGAELDYKLDGLGKLLNGAATLSGTYYFQDQRSAILTNVDPAQPLPGITFVNLPSGAKEALAATGNIHIGQLKLVVGPGTSSVRVPIALSYSNRSELVPKPSWKAQIGISYDFDALFTK